MLYLFILPMTRLVSPCQRNRICIRYFLSLLSTSTIMIPIGIGIGRSSHNWRITFVFIITESMQGSTGTSTSSGKTAQIWPQLPWSIGFALILTMVTVVVHTITMAIGRLKFASIKVSTIVSLRWKPGWGGQGWCTIDFSRWIFIVIILIVSLR